MNNQNQKLWSTNFIVLLVMSVISSTAFVMIAPVITEYSLNIGLNLDLAGIVAGAISISALVMRPFSGVLSDKISKRLLIIISLIGTSVCIIGYSISQSFAMLMLFRILHGLVFCLNSTATAALAVDFIPKDKMGEGLGYLGIGYVISNAIGPSIGLWLIDQFGYSTFFLVASVLPFISSIIMISVRSIKDNTTKEERKSVKINLSDLFGKEALFYGLTNGFFSLTNGLCSAFLALMSDERGILNVGIFFTVSAITIFIIRPFSGIITDKYGPVPVVLVGFLFTIASMILLANAATLLHIILAGIIKAIGQGSGQLALQTICLNKMGANRRGAAISIYYLGADLGQGLGPLIGGRIVSAFNYNILFTSTSGLLFFAMLAFWGYTKFIDDYFKKGRVLPVDISS